MSKGEALIGQATDEQIQEWKKKYENIYAIIVGGHIAYLKKPDRKILGFATTAGKTNPIRFNEQILNNCFLGGSEEIKTDDKLFFGASAKLADLIQVEEAELVNL